MTDTRYLLDQLETADMLEIDGLHAFDFSLDEALLDQADAAAEAELPFSSELQLLSIEVLEGRERRRWQFSYNDVMEAEHNAEDDIWTIAGGHRLKCLGAIGATGEND